jgi:F-type H+-transporting ATPase subunit a
MNFEAVLHHHILDHRLVTLFTLGPVTFAITKHLLVEWCVGVFLLATLTFAARGTSTPARMLRMGVEAVVLYLRDTVVHPLLGHSADKYLHYFLTVFFFVLCCNLAGLIPGSATPTGNIAVTAALATCTFILILIAGAVEQGPLNYVMHIVPSGVPFWLYPLMFVVEVSGLFVKCIALTIRLFANMIAGHIVALAFMSLIFIFGAVSKHLGVFVVGPFAIALVTFVNCLELLVALLQAFIFTLLTVVFVSQAAHPH